MMLKLKLFHRRRLMTRGALLRGLLPGVSMGVLTVLLLSPLGSGVYAQVPRAEVDVSLREHRSVAVSPEQVVTFLGISTHGPRVPDTTKPGRAVKKDSASVGLTVVAILADSPAAYVLRKGDVITHFAGETLTSPRQLGVLVRSRQPGDEVALTLLRAGQSQGVRVKLRQRALPPLPERAGAEGLDEAQLAAQPGGAGNRP